ASGVPRPQFHRHQFGFTLGGPVYIPKLFPHKRKIYWFTDFEALRQSSPQSLTTTVPTPAFENGDFSALLGPQIGTDALGRPIYQGEIYDPFSTRQVTAGQVDPVTGLMSTQTGYIRDPFPGNIISPTEAINSVSGNFLKYFPSPTCSSCGYVNNYTYAIGAPVRSTEYTIRGDFNINEKTHAYARWSHKLQEKTETPEFFGSDNVGGGGSIAPDNRWDAAMGITRMISPTFVASFNAGWGRWIEGRVTQGVPFSPSTLGFPSFLNFANAFPTISIDGGYNDGNGTALGSGGLNSTPREARSIALDLTKVKGAHTLQFGFMGIELIQNTFNSSIPNFSFPLGMTAGPDPTNANPATGWGFASFLLGTGNSGGVTINADAAFMKKYYGWYFQDQWRATPKLSLNLGIRYDFQTAPTDRFDRLSYFDFTAPNPIS
ncbi:MAG: hypothetical protein P8Z30_20940, partial [Acidobacteriota bacterium]